VRGAARGGGAEHCGGVWMGLERGQGHGRSVKGFACQARRSSVALAFGDVTFPTCPGAA
jgi:hypothetical protein